MTFASLGLAPALLRALEERGHASPTAVQAAAIPAALAGSDVLASAQTGSGKTAAYALPILQRLALTRADTPQERSRGTPRAITVLVLVPTRELAVQVVDTVVALAGRLPNAPKTVALFGGVSVNPQMMALRGGADILVATPGRLLDLVDRHALSLQQVHTLVLDEADRLLDAGFAAELQRTLALLTTQRQTLLFSATFPFEVQRLAQSMLRDPLRIDVPAADTAEPDITQRAIVVETARRTLLLRHLVQTEGWTRVLVFVATQYASEHVAEKLRRQGVAAASFHGDLAQGRRSETLADFKAGRLQVIVATDLAARGLDILALPVVVNFDLPRSPVDHVHRIGRTGRAGETGLAVSFICAENAQAEAHFRLIEKRQGGRVAREQIAGFEPAARAAAQPGTGGIKGQRPSKKDKLRQAQLASVPKAGP